MMRRQLWDEGGDVWVAPNQELTEFYGSGVGRSAGWRPSLPLVETAGKNGEMFLCAVQGKKW
jgi:hypothetical protein